MKYWLLTTEYPPFAGGGIGTYCFYTARMLRRHGHDVTVFMHDLSLSEDKISMEDGVRVARFVPRQTGAHQFLGFNAYISYEYAEIVRRFMTSEGKPDIIESQEYHGIAYYLQQFSLLGYKPFDDLDIVVTCHAPAFLCLEYNQVPIYQLPEYWTGQMEKNCIRSADLLISPSSYFVKEATQRMNWDDIDEKYVVNPIEIDSQSTVPEYKPNHIVCLGKLSPLKGTFILLQRFKALWDKGFAHPLHIIGGTQQIFHPEGLTMFDIVSKKYQQYIADGRLVLAGELPLKEVQSNILDAHVVIVPSIVDNLPYTVLEAMSCGKVVLASKQGGQSEIITDGEDGFLFDHYTENDFEEKLQYILQMDSRQVHDIGKHAMQTMRRHYSSDVVYEKKMKAIREYRATKQKRNNFPFLNGASSKYNAQHDNATPGLLSVVIPYFNMGKYIEECVQSVLAAEYPYKEVIIVNDGSTEVGTEALLASIQQRYQVKVIHKENTGLPRTRNFGASQARGQYLAFLDADDKVDPVYYTRAIDVLKKYQDVHFVGCWVKYFGTSQGHWPSFNPELPYLLVHNMINSSAIVYRRQSFLAHGLNDPELIYGMEDWDSVISLMGSKCGGVVLPEPLFHYRVRKDSMTRSFTRVKQLHLYRLIGKKHKHLYKEYGEEIAHLLNANGSSLFIENPSMESPGATAHRFGRIPSFLRERLKEKVKSNKYLRNIAYTIYKQFKN